MQSRHFIRSVSVHLKRLFCPRSIIVISDHKTDHFSISARHQLISFLLAALLVGGGSFVAGGYFATKSELQEREEALKQVADSRVDSNFTYFAPTLQPELFSPVSSAVMLPVADPAFSSSEAGQEKLIARIAFLETRVKELRETNEDIVQAVREKTNDKIADLEEVIRKTGLDPKRLQKSMLNTETQEDGPLLSMKTGGQGGPFIEDNVTDTILQQTDLFAPLDKLVVLDKIVDTLPLASPLPSADTQSLFGRRIDPFTGRLAFHAGVDLSGPAGAKVHATNDGKISLAGYSGAYGNLVEIDHGYGITSRYGHLSQIKVREGQQVRKGDIIGVQGSTGRSTGAHVHYEVRYHNQPLNPVNFLKAGTYVSQNQ